MSHLPLFVRVAAGLVITAAEQARKLPEQLAELPVTAASKAVQTGMRVQQRLTELAVKGDEVFSLFQPVEDTPPWARFDEDEDDDHAAEPASPADQLAPVVPGPGSVRPGGTGRAGPDEPVRAVVPDEGDVAKAAGRADRPAPRPTGQRGTRNGRARPPALPGYDEMTLPQLRGKLRSLSLPQLEELLAYEQAHGDRAPFVTMLSNRITTVRAK